MTFQGKNAGMNILAAAKNFNENAIRENWNHVCDPTLAFSDPCYEKFLTIWRSKAVFSECNASILRPVSLTSR